MKVKLDFLVLYCSITEQNLSFRKQEGTEIFDGRKDHVNRLVMHYVEAPEIISTTDYGNAIDERTAKTEISAEEAEKENAIPDTVVGFIGAKESQKFAL